MKKITLLICLLLILVGMNAFTQQLGDKVYKEVIVDGKKVNKWLMINALYDFDDKGDRTHAKFEGEEWWYDHDTNGNTIHSKSSDGLEGWFEYDAKGNKTREKWSDGEESFPEYDDRGNIICFRWSNGLLEWMEYDKKGKETHYKTSDGYEDWSEYDTKGDLIYQKWSDGEEDGEYWFFYEFKNGKKVKGLRCSDF